MRMAWQTLEVFSADLAALEIARGDPAMAESAGRWVRQRVVSGGLAARVVLLTPAVAVNLLSLVFHGKSYATVPLRARRSLAFRIINTEFPVFATWSRVIRVLAVSYVFAARYE